MTTAAYALVLCASIWNIGIVGDYYYYYHYSTTVVVVLLLLHYYHYYGHYDAVVWIIYRG